MRLCLCVPVCDSYPNYVLGSTAHARITNSCSGADLSIFPFSQRVLIRQLYKTRKVTTKTHAKRRDKHDKRWNKISTALGHGQLKLSKTKRTTKPPVPGAKQSEYVENARRLRCVFNVFFAQEQITRIILLAALESYLSMCVMRFFYLIFAHSHTLTHAQNIRRGGRRLFVSKPTVFFKASMHMHLSVYIHICVNLYLLLNLQKTRWNWAYALGGCFNIKSLDSLQLVMEKTNIVLLLNWPFKVVVAVLLLCPYN